VLPTYVLLHIKLLQKAPADISRGFLVVRFPGSHGRRAAVDSNDPVTAGNMRFL